MGRIYSLAYLNSHRCTPAEAIRIAAQTGYPYVGLRLWPNAPGAPQQHLLGQPAALREALAAQKDTGVGVFDLEIIRINEQFDPHLDWKKVERIRDQWGGKLILKGILDEDDARAAADFGADAIVVSNHGGRQLDGALSSIRMLPRIVRAVGDKTEVFLDSGIRSGQDVLKALALGAKGTMIGRAYIHGLGAMGEAGVTAALEVIRKELDITMALCGEKSVANLGRHNLLIPRDFEGDYL